MEWAVLLGVGLVVYAFVQVSRRRRPAKPSSSPPGRQASQGEEMPKIVTGPEDEKDAWEGAFWEVGSPRPAVCRWRIRYQDSGGAVRERDITTKRYGPHYDSTLISAHCHMRNAFRTFVASRIQSCVDLDTGEVVSDPVAALQAVYDASPSRLLDELVEQEMDVIRALCHVGRADGRMTAKEREIILALCHEIAGNQAMSDKALLELLRDLGTPTVSAFNAAVRRLELRPAEFTRLVFRAAQAMVATQKTVDPAEQKALDYMHKRWAPQWSAEA